MKVICPKCKGEFFQEIGGCKEAILKFIKNNSGCSISDIHYDVRIAVKNVWVWIQKLEKDKLIIVKRDKKGTKAKIYSNTENDLQKKKRKIKRA